MKYEITYAAKSAREVVEHLSKDATLLRVLPKKGTEDFEVLTIGCNSNFKLLETLADSTRRTF